MTVTPKFVLTLALTVVLSGACSEKPDVAKAEALARGNAYFDQEKYREAIIEYRRAIQVDPRYGVARHRLSEAYFKVNDIQGAFREIIRAADLLPKDVTVQLEAASFLLAVGRFEDAQQRTDRVLELDKRNARAHVLRGNALARLKDLDGALKEMEEAIVLEPTRSLAYAGLGTIQFARKQTEEADRAFEKALALEPSSAPIRLAFVNFLMAQARWDDAEKELKASLKLDPKNVMVNRTLASFLVLRRRDAEAEPYLKELAEGTNDTAAKFALVRLYLATDRRDEAVRRLTALAAQKDTFLEATLRLAGLSYDTGQTAQGHQLLNSVLNASPDYPAGMLLKARFLLAEKKPGEAVAAAKKAVEGDPRLAEGFFALGEAYAGLKEFEEAKKAFNEVLKVEPNSVRAQLALSRLHLLTGGADLAQQFAERAATLAPNASATQSAVVRAALLKNDLPRAESELKKLLAGAPNNADGRVLEGTLRLMQKNVPAAERSFLEAVKLAPLSVPAATGLMQVYFGTGRAADARTRIEHLQVAAPDDPDVLLLAARTYVTLKDFTKTEQALRRIIEVDPSRNEPYTMLGQLYVSQGRLADAMKEFQTLVDRQPKSVGAHTMVAVLFEQQKRRNEAKGSYRKALAIDSTAAVAANNLAWLMAEDNENLDEALQLAQTAKTRLPQSPDVADTLGFVYYKKGLASQAVAVLKEAIDKQPDNAIYQYHLGLAYAKNGDLKLARQMLESALKRAPNSSDATEARNTLSQLAVLGS